MKLLNRRHMLSLTSGVTAAFLTRPGMFAEELALTPKLTEGPFYPDRLPLDTDNDLLLVNQSITPAVGEITHLSGKILTKAGSPLRNAFVEIWQCDNNGAYRHKGTSNADKSDGNFQGYGRFLTDSQGQYYFRTIKPVPYPGRTPHIHVAVSLNGQRVLTTQLFVQGHPQNERDGLFRGVGDADQQRRVSASFEKIADSKLGELAANFDIVLGRTPVESDDGKILGGIGASDRDRRMGRGER